MQRRAEVRAVERKHARLLQLDVERLRFARVHHHVDVVLDQAEAVNHVARLLDVRHVHGEIVAHLRVDPVRIEPAADGDHFGHDLIAVARHAGLRLYPRPRSDPCFRLSDKLRSAAFRSP